MISQSSNGFNSRRKDCRPESKWAGRPERDVQGARHDGDASLALCRDIVIGAMRAYQGLPIELNERVEIALTPSISFHGNIIWINGPNCGVAFEKRENGAVRLASAAGDRQRAKESRAQARAIRPFGHCHVGNAAVETGRTPCEAEARRDGVFVAGLRVRLLLGGDRERRATVRWSRDDIAELFLS